MLSQVPFQDAMEASGIVFILFCDPITATSYVVLTVGISSLLHEFAYLFPKSLPSVFCTPQTSVGNTGLCDVMMFAYNYWIHRRYNIIIILFICKGLHYHSGCKHILMILKSKRSNETSRHFMHKSFLYISTSTSHLPENTYGLKMST